MITRALPLCHLLLTLCSALLSLCHLRLTLCNDHSSSPSLSGIVYLLFTALQPLSHQHTPPSQACKEGHPAAAILSALWPAIPSILALDASRASVGVCHLLGKALHAAPGALQPALPDIVAFMQSAVAHNLVACIELLAVLVERESDALGKNLPGLLESAFAIALSMINEVRVKIFKSEGGSSRSRCSRREAMQEEKRKTAPKQRVWRERKRTTNC